MKSQMSSEKPLNKGQIKNLAYTIYQMFKENGMWQDVHIYFNGCCIDTVDEDGKSHYNSMAYEHPDEDPRNYFSYVNPDHILSMSFEGPVYEMFNYGGYPSVLERFTDLLSKAGLYYELGNAWNLTCYYK